MSIKRYKHIEYLSLTELETFCKEHPEIWGESKYLFHPDNGMVIPENGGCDLCPYCEGLESYNCMNLTYQLSY